MLDIVAAAWYTVAIMDDKTYIGANAELKAISYFARIGYDIFTQFSGKAPFDFVAHKDGIMLRVEAKGTVSTNRYGSYVAQIRSVRSNKTSNTIRHFDSGSCDVLAIYILPTDELLLLNPAKYHGMGSVTFGKKFYVEYNAEGQSDWRLNLT